MERYDPRLSEYAGKMWLRESAARLPVSDMEGERPIPGCPGYFIDAGGTVYRAAHTDCCNRRHGRKVLRTRTVKGSSQYRFWVEKKPKWMSEKKLLKVLNI